MVDTFITEVSQDTWIFFPWDMALQYVEPYRGATEERGLVPARPAADQREPGRAGRSAPRKPAAGDRRGGAVDPGAHLYGPVLGLPELRGARGAVVGGLRRGDRRSAGRDHERMQSGVLRRDGDACRPGDEVLLPTPWYFNHKMWLDMGGVRAVPLPPCTGLLPDPRTRRAPSPTGPGPSSSSRRTIRAGWNTPPSWCTPSATSRGRRASR
jgi:hypothetical protein